VISGAAAISEVKYRIVLNHHWMATAICCLGASVLYGADERPGKTFKTSSGTLYYETLGSADGTPLVVANGGPGFDHSYLHLSDVWDAMAKKRKVVLYDQRGVGRSSALAPGQSCTLRDQIEDLEAVRAQIGAERIDLLGHLVMAYAARYPQHIQHLMIVDSAAPKFSDTVFLFKDIFPEGVAREDALEFAGLMGDKAARAKSLREYFSMLFYSPEKRDAALAKMTDVNENVEINETIEHDLERFDLNPELQKYNFPTLVMTGRYDINVAPVVAYKIHKAIPGSQFVVFDQSGHLPFYEEPEKFVRSVESFLK
jgi:proline iminopeptidase